MSTTTSQHKKRILNRVKSLSDDKRTRLDEFLDKMEIAYSNEVSSFNFVGIFHDLDAESFKDISSNSNPC